MIAQADGEPVGVVLGGAVLAGVLLIPTAHVRRSLVEHELVRSGVRTTATVRGCTRTRGYWSIRIAFEAEDGAPVDVITEHPDCGGQEVRPGMSVAVRYDRRRPRRVLLVGADPPKGGDTSNLS
jgi:hypothetical protein